MARRTPGGGHRLARAWHGFYSGLLLHVGGCLGTAPSRWLRPSYLGTRVGSSNRSGTGFGALPSGRETRSRSRPSPASRCRGFSRKWSRTFGSLTPNTFVLDGELVLPIDGTLSFDALQMRLHPADSRIERLSRETPASLILRLPSDKSRSGSSGASVRGTPRQPRIPLCRSRRARGHSLTPFTRDLRKAKAWLAGRHGQVDGVMSKRLDLPYRPGERAMLKVKHLRTADCVVGGFRYESGRRRWARCCSASLTTAASSIMSALPRHRRSGEARAHRSVWKS